MHEQKVLNYKRIDTGEPSHFVFGDISVLKQNLEIKYGSLMHNTEPPIWVAHGCICFDPTRVTDVHYGASDA